MVERAGKIIWLLGLLAFVLAIVFPFYWMLISSTKTFAEISGPTPVFLPGRITLGAYRDVLVRHHFLRYFRNSLVVAGASAVLATALATLGAYALTRLWFRGRTTVARATLLVYMLPAVLLMIPLFSMLSSVGLTDSLPGLALVYLAQTLPVSMYMLGNYFRSIPQELEEAGMADGATRLGVIWRITLPLSLPALAGVLLYAFVIAWNDFLFAFVLINSEELRTLPLGFQSIYDSLHTPWDEVMAASTIIALPVMVLFTAFQSLLVKGLTAGGVKGE